jgi:hypothetical protein
VTEQQPQHRPTRQPVRDDAKARVEWMIRDPEGYFADARAKAAPVVKKEIQQKVDAMERSQKDASRQKRRRVLDRVRDVARRAVGGHSRSGR